MSALKSHPSGTYSFLPGIPAFSEGIVAAEGYRIVHVRLTRPMAIHPGYDLIEKTIADANSSISSLCGVELRIPEQMEIPAFRALNSGYIAQLRDVWGLFVDGVNPVPRCNLALTIDPVHEPSLFGFSYVESGKVGTPNFVTAGINDAALIFGKDVFAKVAQGIVPDRLETAPDDASPDAVEQRLSFILDMARQRLEALGISWEAASQVELYLAHPLGDLMRSHVLPAVGAAGRRGIRWHCGHAPFLGPQAEMDVRGYSREVELVV